MFKNLFATQLVLDDRTLGIFGQDLLEALFLVSHRTVLAIGSVNGNSIDPTLERTGSFIGIYVIMDFDKGILNDVFGVLKILGSSLKNEKQLLSAAIIKGFFDVWIPID
jgi:hypothetical protein